MWSYYAILLLPFVCVLPAISSTEKSGERCQATHLLTMQQECRSENEDMLSAEANEENAKLCQSLYELWHCVAVHVPVCFHNITEIYNPYFHSPHNCALTGDQIITLQKIYNSAKAGNGIEIIPLSSSTSTPAASTTTLLSTSTEDDGGGGSYNTTVVNATGNVHKHTGAGVRLSCQYTVTEVVIAWLAFWRMTSYLLLS